MRFVFYFSLRLYHADADMMEWHETRRLIRAPLFNNKSGDSASGSFELVQNNVAIAFYVTYLHFVMRKVDSRPIVVAWCGAAY